MADPPKTDPPKTDGFNIKYVLIGVLFMLQCVGIYDLFFSLDANDCEMTYMWQDPEYIVSIN